MKLHQLSIYFFLLLIQNETYSLAIIGKICYLKPFNVVGMIFSDINLEWYYLILRRKFVMIIDKQTSYWADDHNK